MIRIDVTRHAYDRMKERLGLNKKAAVRIAEMAYESGIRHGETNGRLYRYISKEARAYMRKGFCMKIYGETVFCFIDKVDQDGGERITSLVTVWPIPQNLKNQVLGIQRRKKDEYGNENG